MGTPSDLLAGESSEPAWPAALADLPELRVSGAGRRVLRLPELDNVPLTPAVVELIDHPHFQRLRRVRQLGPTLLVYPGATHTRFEHSVGAYGVAVRYMRSLLQHAHVRAALDAVDVRTVLAAALLHDVGHYPFAHTLEALHHQGMDAPRHELLARDIVFGTAPGLPALRTSLAHVLERSLRVDPERVLGLITRPRDALGSPVDRLLQSVISSALDADKMDYLWRDSVHLGVPYGRNYDRERLLNALTTTADGDAIAVTGKGVISAEIFLFCRYTMYSEVYWHHTVRSLSAMLERAWADLAAREALDAQEMTSRLLGVGDDELLRTLAAEAPPRSVAALVLGAMSFDRRRPYKRVVTWSRAYNEPDKLAAYERLYAMSAEEHGRLVARLRKLLARGSRALPDGTLILDVPPRDKDRQPDVAVHRARAHGGEGEYTSLRESSRIVRAIGDDFLDVVKKIRLFVHPDHAAPLAADPPGTERIVMEAVLTA
ncbi:MAG: HD domain-containing protein [Deltaproteobacteria bacterium]|nr:HD domain-containing protein [Deltaproteobacteria bacterium]